jgi:hypothetical protein
VALAARDGEMGGEWGEKGRGGPIKIVGERFHRGFRIDCNVFIGNRPVLPLFSLFLGWRHFWRFFSQPIQMQ